MAGFAQRMGRGGRTAVLLAALVCLPGQALLAQQTRIDHPREYMACMKLAREAPEEGYESALTWASQGGGEAARHCAAAALIELGRYGEAAERLERLAREASAAAVKLRPALLAQSGQAWLLAGKPERARAVQSAALELEPDNVELLIDRSITLADVANYWEALDDLNRAQELAPDRAEVLVLRASAYRYLDSLGLARDDVDRALALDPGNPDGLLERGILRRLAGDTVGARADWIRVLALAPNGPAGDAARANLEKLDVKAD